MVRIERLFAGRNALPRTDYFWPERKVRRDAEAMWEGFEINR